VEVNVQKTTTNAKIIAALNYVFVSSFFLFLNGITLSDNDDHRTTTVAFDGGATVWSVSIFQCNVSLAPRSTQTLFAVSVGNQIMDVAYLGV
jgi:hypothetical protein